MKQYLLPIILFLSSIIVAQENTGTAYHNEIIKVLSSDEFEGREVGTKGQLLSAKFIAEKMKEIGLDAIDETQSYFQDFEFTPRANPHSEKVDENAKPIKVRNVLGFINNDAELTIVIGAHYDHLGHGAEGSLHAAKDGQIHNGADDNASGIAVMLSLAKHLKGDTKYASSNYLFIAFSGEERGLWGSKYYADHPIMDLGTINYMINMDMIGRFDSDRGLAINGVGTSPAWKEIISEDMVDYKLVLSESGVGPSDHTSFYLKDIPVLHFFTGQHEDYHKPSDDIEKINFEGLLIVEGLIIEIIEKASQETKLEFTKTKNESDNTPKFTVTLGVMPDYMYTGEGMRIDGVTEGKPANKAGLLKGDVVVKLGEHEVVDMMSYMKALSQFRKGDETKVEVNREGEIKKYTINF